MQGKVNDLVSNRMSLNAVTYVGKSIGEHTIDLRVESIVKDNIVLLDLLETIKGMDGVRESCGAKLLML